MGHVSNVPRGGGHVENVPHGLSRRPVQGSAAEEVNVQVIDRLAAVSAAVDDGAISVRQTELLGDFLCCEQQVSEQRLIRVLSRREIGQLLFRDHQHMRRSLRRDVMKRQAKIVFMDDLGWDFFVDDPLKDRGHREHLASVERTSGNARHRIKRGFVLGGTGEVRFLAAIPAALSLNRV